MIPVAVVIAKSITFATRLNGGGGSALPGLVVERLFPNILPKLSRKICDKSVVITGTNGKTTTAKLLAAATKQAGYSFIHNRTGSNMRRGVIGALLQEYKLFGKNRHDWGIFEVDEAAFREVGQELKPDIVTVTNLSRDQLDRYGELSKTAEHLKVGMENTPNIVLNADDERVAQLAKPELVNYYGAIDEIKDEIPDDDTVYSAKISATDKHKQYEKVVEITQVFEQEQDTTIHLTVGQENIEIATQLHGVHNAYNIAAVFNTALLMRIDLDKIATAVSSATPAFGRGQQVVYRKKNIQILLVKNPSGFNQTLKYLSKKQRKTSILFMVNDNFADGRDVSWLWDSQLELLKDRKISAFCSGLRGYDMSLRLKYADIDSKTNLDVYSAVDEFVETLDAEEVGYIVPTYTAMLELHDYVLPDKKHEAWI